MIRHGWVKGIVLAAGISIVVLSVLAIDRKQKRMQIPEFVFTYAENQSKDYTTTQGGYKFAELVEKRTGGRIKIIVQAEGILGYEKEIVKQLQFGGIDFARISLSQLSAFSPKFNILQMPYLYKSSEHMWKVLDGKIGDEFLRDTEDFDIVGLSWYDAGARNFYNSVKPIRTLEDLKGLKIRVQESELMADMIEALGALAVPGTYDEVYSNLQREIIDGAENNGPSYESTEHYEVAPYYTVDEHVRIPEIQLCAQATWNKLSQEDQEIIRLCARESALYERALWAVREKDFRKSAEEKGIEIIELSAEEKSRFQKASASVYEKYCTDYMDIIEKIIEMGE